MTTKEFIKRVEELGYRTVQEPNYISIDRVNERLSGIVVVNELYTLDTTFGERTPMELFDLMVEYAKTPVEEREETKKYYLRAEGVEINRNYLNFFANLRVYFFAGNNEPRGYQTQFTEAEIAKLPAWCQALERVEVE